MCVCVYAKMQPTFKILFYQNPLKFKLRELIKKKKKGFPHNNDCLKMYCKLSTSSIFLGFIRTYFYVISLMQHLHYPEPYIASGLLFESTNNFLQTEVRLFCQTCKSLMFLLKNTQTNRKAVWTGLA